MPLPNVWLWVLSVSVTCWALSGRAQDVLDSSAAEQVERERAQPEGYAEPKGYAEAVDAAILAHAEGHFEDAKAQLEKAHAIFPNARTLRGLGKLAFELRNYAAAVAHFEAALRSQARPLDERLRAEVEALLLSARARVGEVQLRIEPEDAKLWVDEVLVSSGTRAALVLSAGSHLIEVRRDGFESALQRFDVRSGESTELRVALTQVAEPASQHVPASVPIAKRLFARAPEGALRPRARWARWLSVGLATAAAVGAAVAVAVAVDPAPNEHTVEGGTSGVVLRSIP